jgi:hypothetical protein
MFHCTATGSTNLARPRKPLHQYSLIQRQRADGCIAEVFAAHAPRLVPYMNGTGVINNDHDMFLHELSHAMELFNRGQKKRLVLNNFGWEISKIGHFNRASAEAECRTIAIQHLLHKKFNIPVVVLSVSSFAFLIGAENMWVDPSEAKAWTAECNVEDRIVDNMNRFDPIVLKLLEDTVDYIVDNCPMGL